ncbi:polyprenyl synthetase family protein [Cytobacillus sp. Hm23]
MQVEVAEYLSEQKKVIEKNLLTDIQALSSPDILKESMNYSLQAGGKRLRPLLLLATLRAFNKDEDLGIDVAVAIELIHTYSLVHDDLPSMDDDDLRRGNPTNHKVFGEAIAILAGDALLTYSFQLIADINHPSVLPEVKLLLISKLAQAAGPEGMVGGQVADIQSEGKTPSIETLEYIHKHKTGKLLAYSVIAGAILAGASDEQLSALTEFAMHIGLAFQIRDDILDIEGSEDKIGKPIGSDEELDKMTYPALLTLSGAKEKLSFHITHAKFKLQQANINHDILEYICDLIATREN